MGTGKIKEIFDSIEQENKRTQSKISELISSTDYTETYKQGKEQRIREEHAVKVAGMRESGIKVLNDMLKREEVSVDFTNTTLLTALNAVELLKDSIDNNLLLDIALPFIGKQKSLEVLYNFCKKHKVYTSALEEYMYPVQESYDYLNRALYNLCKSPDNRVDSGVYETLAVFDSCSQIPTTQAVLSEIEYTHQYF